MQLSQVSKKVNKKINKKEKSINNSLYIMGLILLVFAALFLVYGVDMNHVEYALSKRIPSVIFAGTTQSNMNDRIVEEKSIELNQEISSIDCILGYLNL